MTKFEPYQTSDCGMFWDYNFKILGIVFEISVEKETGILWITKDQNQGT